MMQKLTPPKAEVHYKVRVDFEGPYGSELLSNEEADYSGFSSYNFAPYRYTPISDGGVHGVNGSVEFGVYATTVGEAADKAIKKLEANKCFYPGFLNDAKAFEIAVSRNTVY